MIEEKVVLKFEGFHLDLRSRALKRGEKPVALNSKTLDVLIYLAFNAERVVTREELLRAVWPDAIVEESNLSQHVFLLRKALGKQSAWIVTVPGRGYHFAAPVETVPVERLGSSLPRPAYPGGMILQAVQTTTELVVEETEETETSISERPLEIPRKRSPWLPIAVAAGVILAAGSATWFWLNRPGPVLRKVVLADFQNRTGEPIFDDSLQSALRIDMEQSPYIDMLGRNQMVETLAAMEKPADTRLTGDVAREVCERSNHQVLLAGTITRIGSEYLLTLEATSCATGETVAAGKDQVSNENGVLGALDVLTRKLRRELGESSRQVAQFQVPIAQATTSSLEALRAYSQALDSSDRGDTVGERTLLEHAIALDPNFASAYKQLAISYNNRLDYVQSEANMQKAYDLRAHTTERERLSIEIAHDNDTFNDWEAGVAAMRAYSQIYPDDAANWYNMARVYSALGLYREAIAAGERGYKLAPHSGSGADILARVYRRADRFADAKRVAAAAIADGKDRWGIHRTLFGIAFAEYDTAAMQTQSDWGLVHHEVGQSLIDQGFVAASQGKLREARADFMRAREEGLKSGDADFADVASMYLAGILIFYGDSAGAKACMKQIRFAGEDEGTIAYFFEMLGDPGPTRRLIAEYGQSNTQSTLHLYFDLPEMRALLDLKAHRPNDSLADLEPARKYQLRDYGVPWQCAQAEEEAGLLDQAAADYRLILAHPGIEPTWPAYMLSHLYLARILAQQKRTAEARAEYEAFLDRWRNADPDLPLYRQARREYAALASTHS
ncbi:MAG: winged helix-turn-helix domain-containing protein [Terracidiphilus sp.]|jgi:DNA-binding winged helix-turn-helix (wHTH) protein/tetratricopeptide (TPR) repeat protein